MILTEDRFHLVLGQGMAPPLKPLLKLGFGILLRGLRGALRELRPIEAEHQRLRSLRAPIQQNSAEERFHHIG